MIFDIEDPLWSEYAVDATAGNDAMPKKSTEPQDHKSSAGLVHDFVIEHQSEGKGSPHVVSRGWWIQHPSGKPGEKISVDVLPPEQEDALAERVFNSFRPVLLDRIHGYPKGTGLDVDDFTSEQWSRLVHATFGLLFSSEGTSRETEEMGKLLDLLKEVARRKLASLEKIPPQKPSASRPS